MAENESSLILACLNGDQVAWNELVESYGRLVYSIPLRSGLARADAEEIFQEVFIIIFLQLRKLREHKALAGWIISITWRETIRFAKRRKIVIQLDPNEGETSLLTTAKETLPIEIVQRWEYQHSVREALKRLESPCRELITFLFLEDPLPSYEEIAKRLGIPVGSIGPSRSRCLKKLETLLAPMNLDWGA